MKTKFHNKYFKSLEKKQKEDKFEFSDYVFIFIVLFLIFLVNIPNLIFGLIGWCFNDKTLFESTIGQIDIWKGDKL